MTRARLLVRTALAVGEGKAECMFLKHIKANYVARGSGLTMKVKGGFGKGAKGVLDYAIGQVRNSDFDVCVALLDTDVDWDGTQRTRAHQEGIKVVESSPCLEAWLLAVHGFGGQQKTADHKAEFKRRFGAPAHDIGLMERHFNLSVLNGARSHVQPLDQLLSVLGL